MQGSVQNEFKEDYRLRGEAHRVGACTLGKPCMSIIVCVLFRMVSHRDKSGHTGRTTGARGGELDSGSLHSQGDSAAAISDLLQPSSFRYACEGARPCMRDL